MTDGEALLAAILAAPDDTPRLVYADWLDENGVPDRAEFIRLQIALARDRTIALLAREKALLALHEEEWLAPFKAPDGPLRGEAHGQFRRGFVEIVWMPATEFRLRAEVLFQKLPLRELRVTRMTETEFGELMEYPLVGRLTGLDLSDRRLGDAVVHMVMWSPFTAGLRALRLRGCGITDEGAYELADANLPFRELDVSHNPISPIGISMLQYNYGEALRNDITVRYA